MRNQIEAAERLGINAQTINSHNTDDWDAVKADLLQGKVDLLLISPERLANDDFVEDVLLQIASRVGLFVVDEAHCISDWGHDFRPDYKRITRILQALPRNLPVLATTATANNRVVDDVAAQFGGQIKILRGPLVRKSLRLQNIHMPDQAARMAWLANTLPQIEGSGIIYALTVKDSDRLAEWLRTQGIKAYPYHADLSREERITREQQLLQDKIKALVATTALAMGFDKPNLGFVIHYQRPGSVVHYYQQVGRAGRAVDEAFGILLSGEEDEEITDYFITNAFPPLAHTTDILRVLEDAPDGLTIFQMMQGLNLSYGQIEKVLKLLSFESPSSVTKIDRRWHRTAVEYVADARKVEHLTTLRRHEQARMADYMTTTDCLMSFLSRELDDPYAADCGICESCAGSPLLPLEYPIELGAEASRFLRKQFETIEPKKMWPASSELASHKGKIKPELLAMPGRALCIWADAGWGEMVKRGKQEDGRFDDKLVQAAVELIQNRWNMDPPLKWITCIPSLSRELLVPDLARRLAIALNIPFHKCIVKTRETEPQKLMHNSHQQVANIAGAFSIEPDRLLPGPVLLVDDIVSSGWTFTVVAYLLREAGVEAVYPFALAKLGLSKGS